MFTCKRRNNIIRRNKGTKNEIIKKTLNDIIVYNVISH